MTRFLLFSSYMSWYFVLFFSLYILNYRRAVLLVFSLFSERVVLYVVVALVLLWEEMSAGSSYSSIFIPP